MRSRIPSQSADQSAGQARTGTGAVRSRDCLDVRVITPLGRAIGPRDGMVRRGQRQPGAVIMSAGRAPRIASASIPASPVGTGQAVTVAAVAAGPVAARVLAAAARRPLSAGYR